MANTFSQLYAQLVFAVERREHLIDKEHKEETQKYITGVIKNRGQKLITINAMPDHIHIFIEFQPSLKISDLVRDIKTSSCQFINQQNFSKHQFNWQNGYGAFSYGHSQIDAVYQYIQNQENHHNQSTFKEEYLDFLDKFQIPFEERYLFKWI